MRIYCGYCGRLIKVDNDLRYTCPRCHVQTTVTPGRCYSSLSSSELDDYWKLFNLQLRRATLSRENLILNIVIAAGIIGIIAAIVCFGCCEFSALLG